MIVRPTTAVDLGGWTVEAVQGPVPEGIHGVVVPATVPGVVHTDLLAAGLIPDPYLGTNEDTQKWIGRTSWRYRTSIEWMPDEHDRTDLVFEGLDTVATVTLNGEVVLRAENQHRSYRVSVRELLHEGPNELVVDFAAPIAEADRRSLELGYRPHVNHHPYNALRKMACSFGWDWGIDTATSGIWRPARLESWSGARLAATRAIATVVDGGAAQDADSGPGTVDGPRADGRRWAVDIHLEVERASATGALQLDVQLDGRTVTAELPAGESTTVVRVDVADPALWWPVGYGAQPLSDVRIELSDAGAALGAATHRVGFREVRLDMTPDADGTPFTIVVNGERVFARGVNWIPDDAFPHRVDAARYRRRLEQALDANVNLVRVWGGGLYELEEFYDAADELGLLVWQDFTLACAAYAEEDPLRGEIEAEAREAVARLASHPSLVVLNGNNENVWGYADWNWPLRLEGRTWGEGYYYELFPSIVAELAPHVPYTPGSPFSPDRALHPNDAANGTMHLWEQWNREDYPTYRDQKPRFVAEFGWQGPPAWATLTESLDDAPLTPESPGMLVHQKAMEGNSKLTDGLLPHYPLPNSMPEWHWAMQLNQANAITVAIEHFRSLSPYCSGAIVWQLNDCWPVVSWASIDGYGRPKPLHHALRHAFADVLVTVQPEGDALVAHVINDCAAPLAGDLVIARRSFAGEVLATQTVRLDLPPRSHERITLDADVSRPADPAAELVTATIGEHRGLTFFAEPRASRLGAAELEATAEREADGIRVRVTARTLVRDLALLADVAHPSAEVDEQLVTLLPGESAQFVVRGAGDLDPELLLAPAVLRSANQLLATPSATATRENR